MKIIDLDILSVRPHSFKIKLLFLIVYIKTQSILKKKHLFYSIVILIGVIYIALKPGKLPSYNPERDYLDMEAPILEAFITAKDSSVIQLPEGHYLFSQSLILDGKKGITIRGMGMDKTILSFKGQKQGAEGIRISNCENIVIENLALEDAAGDNLKVTDTDGIIMRKIRSAWTGQVSSKNGAYALYPVLCNNVIIEDCEAIGSSDAGIYVGQSNHVIIRNNKAYYNVAGIESENSTNVQIYNNEAFQNTGGLLIFNLPNLTVYGSKIKAYDNYIHDNNIKNFGVKGSIVSSVPRGSGVIIMATKEVDFYNNKVENHKTVNASIVSYEVFTSEKKERKKKKEELKALASGLRAVDNDYRLDGQYNAYPGKVSIHDNRFENKHFFPTLDNDFGLLWVMKNGFKIPDVAYDLILAEDYYLEDNTKNPEYEICVKNNGDINFVVLDAANDFEKFSNDLGPYDCDIEFKTSI